MKFLLLMTGLLMLISCYAAAYAQEQYWPVEFGEIELSDEEIAEADTAAEDSLALPNETDEPEEIDSSVLLFSGKSALYQTFKAHSKLDWQQILPGGEFSQSVSYQYIQLNPENSIQTVDGSGTVLFTNVRNSGLNAGMLWNPVVSYNKRTVGALQSNVDLGPVVSGEVQGIPWLVKGGFYGYTWNDSITPWLLSTTDGRYHTTPGVFGGLSCGNDAELSFLKPLTFSLDASGRAAGGNYLGLIRSGALYTDETGIFGGGDSLFFAVGDSITNGKELYVGEYGGSSFYSNTSWRINHAFSGSAGVRMRERFSTVLRAYYRFDEQSISYPSEESQQNDIRNRTQTLGVSIRTKNSMPVRYTGGFEYGWEYEDWIYKRTFGRNDFPSEDEKNAYIINLSDHFSDRARTDHALTIDLPAGIRALYHFSAIKDSKRYPFVFTESSNVLRRNENENDRIHTDHLASLLYGLDSLFTLELYGKYGHMYHYYYHENRTAESRSTQEYRVGINAKVAYGPLSLREQVYMDAEISDYYFKKVGDTPMAAPPYSRDFSSTLTGSWNVGKQLSLNGKWVSIYSDDGFWYGNAYRADTATLQKELYAIERKGTQYWVDSWVQYVTAALDTVSIGSKFRDIFERRFDFDSETYRISDLDIGYGIEPYARAVVNAGNYSYIVYARRIFNTGDVERWSKRKNWDLALTFRLVW